MSDLTVKKMKDIQVGEFVMGDDGTPRKVLEKHNGVSQLYKVHQTSAEDYIVNDRHILCLRKDNSSLKDGRYPDYSEFTDMNVVDYMNSSNRFREHFHGYKVNSIPYAEKEVKIDPYLLGLWLGDGTSINPQITTPDDEIKEYLRQYAYENGFNLTTNGIKGKTITYRLGMGTNQNNPFLKRLREYNLIHNKHVPQEYISNSERVRLELLAGLLDTDSHMERNGYEIIQKKEVMAKQIKFIADSLGFRTSMSLKRAFIGEKDCGIYYRVFINGDTWKIPCKVKRKKVLKENVHKNKDWHLSQLSVEPIGIGEWCGISIDGNHKYLHSDGTITHNSGKSYAAGTFIERLTFEYNKELEIAHNILFCRYTMTAASISVIPEFTEKIDIDGTNEFFRSTKTDVVNKMTGSRVMFRGIHTSSGNQTAKLKSIQGLTTFVVDEGEEWTSYEDFEKIMLSIRQKGLQNRIIIIMNPADTNHFVYEKYIKDTHKLVEFDGVPVQISTHPNVLHIHTSYLDNLEHLDDKFLEAAREMKENDPERYAHVFMGRWDDVAEGAVFKKFGIVDEFPAECQHVGLGMDFGYFPDPSAVVRCGLIGNRLYVDEIAYAQGWHAPQMAECLNQYPDLFTYGESADERLTNDIANLGPIIYRVEKGPGSIMAGINKMLEYELFITKRSVHLEHELRNYVWAKDIFGKYIGMPEDHDNHCFVAGTMVATPNGNRPIEQLREGDKVYTSQGIRRVIRFFENGVKKVIKVRITTDGGEIEIEGTQDHKVKTTDGWKQLSELTKGDKIYLFKSSTERSFTFTQERNISQKGVQDFIVRCGNSTTDKSKKGITSIIRMRILGIMISLTLSVSKVLNICICMLKNTFKTQSTLRGQERTLIVQGSLHQSGIGLRLEGSGIANTQGKLPQGCDSLNVLVNGVEKSLKQKIQRNQSFVPINAEPQQESILGLIMKQESAPVVEKSTQSTSITKTFSAQRVAPQDTEICLGQSVQRIEIVSESLQRVYDIEVEDMHEFFANNLLVHNCIDAWRYWLRGKIQGKILKPRATTKEELGIF